MESSHKAVLIGFSLPACVYLVVAMGPYLVEGIAEILVVPMPVK